MRIPTADEFGQLSPRGLTASQARTQINLPAGAHGIVPNNIGGALTQLGGAAGTLAKKMQDTEDSIGRGELVRQVRDAEIELQKLKASRTGKGHENFVTESEAAFDALRNSDAFNNLSSKDMQWAESYIANRKYDRVLDAIGTRQQGLDEHELTVLDTIDGQLGELATTWFPEDWESGEAQVTIEEAGDIAGQRFEARNKGGIQGDVGSVQQMYREIEERKKTLTQAALKQTFDNTLDADRFDDARAFIEGNRDLLGPVLYEEANDALVEAHFIKTRDELVSDYMDNGDVRTAAEFLKMEPGHQVRTIVAVAAAGANAEAVEALGVGDFVRYIAAKTDLTLEQKRDEIRVRYGNDAERQEQAIQALNGAITHLHEGNVSSARAAMEAQVAIVDTVADGDLVLELEGRLELLESSSDPMLRYMALQAVEEAKQDLGEDLAERYTAIIEEHRRKIIRDARGNPALTNLILDDINLGNTPFHNLTPEQENQIRKQLEDRVEGWQERIERPRTTSNGVMEIFAKIGTGQDVSNTLVGGTPGGGDIIPYAFRQYQRAEGIYTSDGPDRYELAQALSEFNALDDGDLRNMTPAQFDARTSLFRGRDAKYHFGRYLLANRTGEIDTQLSQSDLLAQQTLVATAMTELDARKKIVPIPRSGDKDAARKRSDRDQAETQLTLWAADEIALRKFINEPLDVEGVAKLLADRASTRQVRLESGTKGAPLRVFALQVNQIDDIRVNSSLVTGPIREHTERMMEYWGAYPREKEVIDHIYGLTTVLGPYSGATDAVRLAAELKLKHILKYEGIRSAKLTDARIKAADRLRTREEKRPFLPADEAFGAGVGGP